MANQPQTPSTSTPIFPPSQKLHQIDPKGNLTPARFSLDIKYYNLKIEKLDYSVPPTPSTPFTPLTLLPFSPSPMSPLSSSSFTSPSPNLPTSPNPLPTSPNPLPSPFDKRKTFKLPKFSFSRSFSKISSSGYSTSSSSVPSVAGEELIPFSEIHEIRLTDYNSNSIKISAQAMKEVKTLIGGSRKNTINKLRVIEVLYGKEFNLKSSKFLVIGLVEFGKQQQKEQRSVLDGWVEHVEYLVNESKAMGYFEKLDLWYRKQFDLTTEKNTDNHRLKIWKRFLHRTHHRQYSTHILQSEYNNLQTLLTQQLPNSCTGHIEKPEFDLASRYFVHSNRTVSKIFENFCPGMDYGLLNQLDSATEEEMNEVPILSLFYKLFQNYFAYVERYGKDLPEIGAEMDGVSIYTKSVIRKFADRMRERMVDRVIQEKWLCSYYFLDYLYSSENTIWSQETTTQYQDMTHPLSHYWIYSSHNTYLTGDQYASESNVETYARVLRDGCRCIEIDVWNGPFNKPIVTHGRTLTSAIKLKDVLMVIKEHAFVTSPYPVIISIENHLNLRQQRTMVKYCKSIFGKMLLTTPLLENPEEGSQITQLPSPEQLKHKIILKGRKLPLNQEQKQKLTGTLSNTETTYPQQEPDPDIHEPNPCDCLISGELWKSNEAGLWVPCIMILTNKSMFYIEKRDECEDIGHGKLPNYMKHRDLILRRSVSSLDSNQDLHNDQMWFHGKMPGGRGAANLILSTHGVNGSFLVRNSDTTPGYTLCFYYRDPNIPEEEHGPTVNHCLIHTKDNEDGEKMYFLKENPSEDEMFHSIFELIEHYMRNPLITLKCSMDHLTAPVPPSVTHEEQDYFYKDMDKKSSERILERLPINGAFLGRYRTNYPGEIVISFRVENVIKHCHIRRVGRYLTVADSKFDKLEELVDKYSKIAFYKDIKLNPPVGKELFAQSQQSDCVQRVYASPDYLNSTVKTVKGRVRSIQSFESTDPELLSFKKGEIIVNVVKEHDGWWWGTKSDAVGDEALIPRQFPQSFVEDIEELDEENPFGDFINKGTWKLGSSAKVKVCSDKNVKEYGIKFYISFKYFEAQKRKLGASCSKRKANEWVEMINHVIANDATGRETFEKKIAAEKYNIASEFSDLIVYCISMDKKISPEDYPTKHLINVCLTKSLDELTGDRLFRTNPSFFVWYHQHALTRIYPKGFRLDSSNFSPNRFWNFGSQMVALNFQTPDKPMQWNRGKFKENGGCGYLLKPEVLRGMRQFDPSECDGLEQGVCLTVQIRLISARQLEKQGSGHVTPLVEIEVVGVDADCTKVKTSSQETGLNPHWNETFQLNLRCPELALIQFSVCDVDYFSDRLLLGESTIPFRCIRQGYRSIQLQNAYGAPLLSTLLVHVTVTEQDSTPSS